jgi:hypothetical protein
MNSCGTHAKYEEIQTSVLHIFIDKHLFLFPLNTAAKQLDKIFCVEALL